MVSFCLNCCLQSAKFAYNFGTGSWAGESACLPSSFTGEKLFLSYIEQFREALSEYPEAKAKCTEIIEVEHGFRQFQGKECSFLFAPLTSVNVERLFSTVKDYITERPNLSVENLCHLLFVKSFPE